MKGLAKKVAESVLCHTVRDLPIPICEWVRYDGSVILRDGPFCESLSLHLRSLEVTQTFFFKLSVPDLLREERAEDRKWKMESGGRWGAHAFSNCDSIELRELASRALKSALSLCVLRARLCFLLARHRARPLDTIFQLELPEFHRTKAPSLQRTCIQSTTHNSRHRHPDSTFANREVMMTCLYITQIQHPRCKNAHGNNCNWQIEQILAAFGHACCRNRREGGRKAHVCDEWVESFAVTSD